VTTDDLKEVLYGRPRPKVYACLKGGGKRRILSCGNGWIRIYRDGWKTRIPMGEVRGFEIL
jgi:hypothetical protein